MGYHKIQIAFRVDASLTIGSGHVMRCLVLANRLKKQGAEIVFVCRAHQGHMAERIEDEGYAVMLVPLHGEQRDAHKEKQELGYQSWLGASLETDAAETVRALEGVRPSWIVADHFAINDEWERRVKGAVGAKIMVIDGLANRRHDCDVLLDQTHSPEGRLRWKKLVPSRCELFVGPQYALLRPEFIKARRNLRQRDGTVKRIFVCFGGVDVPNATALAVDAIIAMNSADIIVDVVIGAANPHGKLLKRKCESHQNIVLHVQHANVAELMARADVAIGGGGTMMWERCCLSLPTVSISIAENQVRTAKDLQSLGCDIYVGALEAVSSDLVRASMERLVQDADKLRKMQTECDKLIGVPNGDVIHSLMSAV